MIINMNTNSLAASLPDVAMEIDQRGIALPSVGIRGFRLPMQMKNESGAIQPVVVEAEVGVSITAEQRGAHMSRLVETLYEWASAPRNPQETPELLSQIVDRLQSDQANLRLKFLYFLSQPAPVTGVPGWLEIEVDWQCRYEKGRFESSTRFLFPGMTLCPCSKAISEYGAHNQRAHVRLWLQPDDRLPQLPEAYLPMVNESCSMGIYPVLKRQDEKYVTERAYENPRFVEDVARELTLRLRESNRLQWFRVECESIESIHNHNAFAAYEERTGK